MPQVITFTQESLVGPWARSVRLALQLTQKELAEVAGVSREDVDLFERNLPVQLYAKRKLVKELWAARMVEGQLSSSPGSNNRQFIL